MKIKKFLRQQAEDFFWSLKPWANWFFIYIWKMEIDDFRKTIKEELKHHFNEIRFRTAPGDGIFVEVKNNTAETNKFFYFDTILDLTTEKLENSIPDIVEELHLKINSRHHEN